MALTDLTIIRRSMFGRLFSTVTTIVTVAVAVGLMLVLLSMRDAGRKAFERGSGDMHLLISAEASPLSSLLNGIFYANPPQRAIPYAKFQQIANPRFAPWAYAIPTQQGDSYQGQPILATTPEFFTQFKPNPGESWELASGTFFDADFEVVLGADAARATGLKIGDKISPTHGTAGSRNRNAQEGGEVGHVHDEFKFSVVGILKPTGGSHDRALFISIQSSWLMHAFDRLEREGKLKHDHDHDHDHGEAKAGEAKAADDHADHDHADHDHADHDHGAHDGHDHGAAAEAPIHVEDLTDEDRKITGVYARLATREGSDATTLLPSIFYRLRADPTLTVANPSDEIRKLFVIVGNIDQLFVAMAAVVMVSSGIAIMLALYNSMEQRRRQIAVLRVLGSSRGRIGRLVLAESAAIGLLGAALGVLLALAGGAVAAAVLREQLGLRISPDLSPIPAGVVIGATVLLACLAGLIPAAMAYRTPVAKNLKPIG
jgi:putative ABC transport system permease protein